MTCTIEGSMQSAAKPHGTSWSSGGPTMRLVVGGAWTRVEARSLVPAYAIPKLAWREIVSQTETDMTEATSPKSSKTVLTAPEKMPVALIVNGVNTELRVAPWTSLLDALR